MSALEVVQQVLAAFAVGDRQTVGTLLSPNIVWRQSGPAPLGAEFHGVEAVLDHILGEDHIDDYHLEVHDLLSSPTRAAMVATTTGRLGGEPLVNEFVSLIQVGDDGLIHSVDSYTWDQTGIAAQLAAQPSVSA
jgi:ketosteroid isomerase-like protein